MGPPNYGETVTLLVPHEKPRELALADAVFAVFQNEHHIKRLGAMIVRKGGEQIGHSDMIQIYSRTDFPKRSS